MHFFVTLFICGVQLVSTEENKNCRTFDLENSVPLNGPAFSEFSDGNVIEGTALSVRCKFSAQMTWAFCREGKWIYGDDCKEEVESIARKPTRRRKRFLGRIFRSIIRGIVCLFSRCARPPPRDTTPPEIRNCPNDITEEAIPFQLYTFVTWTEPTAWDNKDGTISVHLSGSKRPGGPFFEGTTRVGYYAKDRSNNQATCNFYIHIKVVRCPTLSPGITDGYRVCHLSSDMVKGTICRYGCYQGHELKGPSRSECLRSGEWSVRSEPYCEKIKCPNIVALGRLSYICTSHLYFRSICTYSCSEGFDIPEDIRRTKVCLANGYWDGEDPYCKDIEAPKFEQCPETLMFFPGDNEESVFVHWDMPTVSDNHDGSIIPVQVEGPQPSTKQNVDTYSVVYNARDSTGNQAKECSFVVVVKQLRCRRLYALPYMNLNCTGTRRGSSCSFSCEDNSFLNGTHKTFCQRVGNKPYSTWDMKEQPFCQVLETCPDLTAPNHGAMACDVWLGGQLCHPSCSGGYSVLVTNPLPSILVCLKDGTWLHKDKVTDCIDRQTSRRRLAEMTVEFYFSGNCHDTDVQIEIKETFISVIKNSASWISKCKTPLCNIENVRVICGETSLKRSTSNMKVDMEIHFVSNPQDGLLKSDDYEAEVTSTSEILDYLELLIDSSNMSISNDEMLFLSMTSSSLEVQCPKNSVPVYDSIIGCIFCSAGTFYDLNTRTCIQCPRGTYQQDVGQGECIICPITKTTATTRSTSPEECEDACLPGTWSPTGLPPCIDCDIGYYEDRYGSVSCKECPGNQITLTEQSSNISDCYDFDVVFPNGTIDVYTELELSSVTLTAPFVISFHLKSDRWTNGNVVQLSTVNGIVVQIDTLSFSIYSKIVTLPDDINFFDKWSHILLHVDTMKSILFIDGINIIEQACVFTEPVSNFTLHLGGDGFSGSISQLYIVEGSHEPAVTNMYKKCLSYEIPNGLLNWRDFAYSILNNAYIQLPSVCDDQDDCESSPCVNGSCTDTLGGYRCYCSSGYTGKNCDQNVDDCIAHACQNNATCLDNVNSYACKCGNGYTGELCEIAMVDGEWSEWDNWTDCSVSCGNGTRMRKRSCSDPLPDNGGKQCDGNDTDTEECGFEPCRECTELLATNHSTITCTNTSDMIFCTHTCDEGYWFDTDVKQEYTCGNETFYFWDFQTEDSQDRRLPFCTEIVESPVIYVDYTAFYNLQQCVSSNFDDVNELIRERITASYHNLTCMKEGTCKLHHYTVLNCKDDSRQRRDVDVNNAGYTATLSCDTTTVGTEDCYFSLADTVTDIKAMEDNHTFEFQYNSNMYKITTNSSSSDSRLDCPTGSVPFIAYCVPCSIGHYYIYGECKECQKGTYQQFTGQTFCYKCPTGTTTKYEGSIAEYDCNVIVPVKDENQPLYLIGVAIGIPFVIVCITVMTIHFRHKRSRSYTTKLFEKSKIFDKVKKTKLDTKILSSKKEMVTNIPDQTNGLSFKNAAFEVEDIEDVQHVKQVDKTNISLDNEVTELNNK